jgi:regulatory protein
MDERPSIRTAALRLLGRRDYTVVELRTKLRDREYDADEIDTLIASLITDKWLDDGRVAAAHVRTASTIKGRGRHRIQQELHARGIAKTTIRDALAGMPAAEEAASLQRFIQRRGVPNDASPQVRRRLFQQLLRRGFPSDAIAKALKPRGFETDDES